jgi:2-octaprenyl-6-methoxyphenol hydroxylase
MENKIYDAAIVGAGPVGMVMALMLKSVGASVVLLEKGQRQTRVDGRYIALSKGSLEILEKALGENFSQLKYEPIKQVHTSLVGHFPRVLMDCVEERLDCLGGVLSYQHLVDVLKEAVLVSQVQIEFSTEVDVVQQKNNQVVIQSIDQREWVASFLVRAEGGTFVQQEKSEIYCDYEQTAIVSRVRISGGVSGRAFERVTEKGPIALLPIGQGEWVCIWSADQQDTNYLMSLEANEYLQILQEQYRGVVGGFLSVENRQTFVLGLNAKKQVSDGRVFYLGNAAQTLHPVAGQGLNLGLRDVVDWIRLWQQSVMNLDQHYAAVRARDRENTINVTNIFVKKFRGVRGVKKWSLSATLFLIENSFLKRRLVDRMLFGCRANLLSESGSFLSKKDNDVEF